MPDKVFLITGASSGIGAATAHAARDAGYKLVLAARSADKLDTLVDELGGSDAALAVSTDVTEWDDVQTLAARATEAFGGVDVAFVNAGFGAKRGWESETVEHWKSMVLTNVYGAAITVRALLPTLRERMGHVLLTGSVAGKRVGRGSLYSCTKWAVGAMGESLRQDFDGTGIRVTTIVPGMVDTPFFDDGAPEWALHPADIADAVMYAVGRPRHVDVNEIVVRPTAQEN